MKNNIIKCLCLFSTMAMLITSTGCNGSANGNSNGSDNISGASSNIPATEGAAADFKGETIKIAVWYEPEKPKLGDSDAGDAWYYSMENAEKKFNAKVEWVINPQETHFSKFVQASLSGEVYADILMSHSWNYVSLIKQKLLTATDEFIDSAPDKDHWEKSLYTFNGSCWALSPTSGYHIPTIKYFYNTKMLKELKLESPQVLALNGKWTWDKFREYCLAATNTSLERYGVACFMLDSALQTTNNFQLVNYDSATKKYYNGYTYDKTKKYGLEMLEFIEKMAVQDKSIYGSWTAGQGALDEGEAAFLDGKVLFVFGRDAQSMKKSGMKDFAPVTAPIGPSATTLTDGVAAFAFWSLPTSSNFSAEDRAAFWMDAKRTWDPSKGKAYYKSDVDTFKEELLATSYWSMEDVDFLMKMGEKIKLVPLLEGSLSLGSIIADGMYGAVIRGESTPSAVIAAADNVIQSKIDSTFNTEVSK